MLQILPAISFILYKIVKSINFFNWCLPNAHDEVDHGYRVEVDSPESHEAEDAQLDGDDGEGHPEAAQRVGDEDEAHDHHDHRRNHHALDRCRQHHQVLQKNLIC